MKILGVDPGIRGGLAIVFVDAMVLRHSSSTRSTSRPLASAPKSALTHSPFATGFCGTQHAFIERGQAMPKQGASSGFRYGRATGALKAAVVLCAIPSEIIEPTAWKRFWHLPGKDKERARQKALEFFPGAHSLLARKRGHGRAEAALLALYGIRNSRFAATPPEAQARSSKP